MGVPPTGTEIALPGITILRFEGDEVVERWSQTDMLGLLVQLGAVPAPA
jgi:predicted ester cyclase